MAFAISFKPASMDAQRYDETIRRLEAAGAGAPAGRLYHACHGEGSDLRVVDIWESMETFETFGQTLMPILQEIGIDPGQPEIRPVHNTIVG
ncbi:MAG TPA: hypothetical protein VIC28_11560 [Thermoanaerobaculia bacterium]|jgi:hypothetical protein